MENTVMHPSPTRTWNLLFVLLSGLMATTALRAQEAATAGATETAAEPAATLPAEPLRPNIIFILADDLGYGDLGVYGQKTIKTPNLDKMAEQGLRFTRHYAGSTVCAPSRNCLLTGYHSGRIFVRGNGKIMLREDPHDVTVATYLQQAGYHTAMIGKASTGGIVYDPAQPNRKGFDHFFGILSHWEAHRYFPETVSRNGEVLAVEGNEGYEGRQYSQDLFMREIQSYLKERAANPEQPFFLHYSMQTPHADLYAPDRFREMYLGQFEEEPGSQWWKYRQESAPKATFAGMVARMDYEVGLILRQLQQLGIAENTLVLFSSDNGGMAEGGHHFDHFDSNGILRGGKRDLYEGGIRVPMIAWWPGQIEPGGVTDHVSAFWDFLPTAMDLAGAPVPAGIDGRSFYPTLMGVPEAQDQHAYLYWEFHARGGRRAVLFGNYKAIQLNVGIPEKATTELYDLSTDPREEFNLAAERPGIVALARLLFQGARQPHKYFNFKGSVGIDGGSITHM